MGEDVSIVAVNIGNSAIAAARFDGNEPDGMHRFLHGQLDLAVQTIVKASRERECAGVVIASVHQPMRDRLIDVLIPQLDVELYRLGEDVPLNLTHTMTDAAYARTGQDRLLNALAAHRLSGAAALIIDAGTAITVDFVDGAGTFHGGAIAPGARMALRALHEHTSALPAIDLRAPEPAPFGRDTEQAMLQGVVYGAQGLVHRLLERYADASGFYPAVIATGGDAPLLFDGDPIVERIVPDLTLRGVAIACRDALADAEDVAS